MKQVNIHEAKTNLSALVEQASRGEAFIIAKSGKPMVTVIPYNLTESSNTRVGFMRGKISIPEDFNSLGADEITRLFGETI